MEAQLDDNTLEANTSSTLSNKEVFSSDGFDVEQTESHLLPP